jgi:LysM repeat protein
MYRRSLPVALAGAAIVACLATPSIADAQSLRGSRSTVERVYERASDNGLHFYKTSGGVKSAAEQGRFVRLTGNADYRLNAVSHPYATATTRTFVERLGAQYHASCGEPMVVTSAIRPMASQPSNSSDWSVHPTGIAVDLRKPTGRCLTWLRKTLLSLEQRGVLDGTEEKHPPHFHVVVFPAAYDAYVESLGGASRSETAARKAAAKTTVAGPRIALATVARMPATTRKYRVKKGDSLWSIAKRYDTTVDTIKRLNPSAARKLLPGQTLVLSAQ